MSTGTDTRYSRSTRSSRRQSRSHSRGTHRRHIRRSSTSKDSLYQPLRKNDTYHHEKRTSIRHSKESRSTSRNRIRRDSLSTSPRCTSSYNKCKRSNSHNNRKRGDYRYSSSSSSGSWKRSPVGRHSRDKRHTPSESVDRYYKKGYRQRSGSLSEGNQNKQHYHKRHSNERDDRRRRNGFRTRDDTDATSRKLDHFKDQIPTTVVAIRHVPVTILEPEIEAAVRSAAISLGFSPPNFVKRAPPPTASPLNNLIDNTTSAFVDFPSSDSAQVFYDACRRDFCLRSKRVILELVRCPPGSVAFLTACKSPEDWVKILDRLEGREYTAEDGSTGSDGTQPLGPGLPCPRLEEFSMDRKSGLLFHESLNLYFDTQTQHYISTSGVYYVKGNNHANKTLIPIYRMPNPLGTAVPNTRFPLPPGADEKPHPIRGIEKQDAEENTSETIPVDSATTKATAVASILAAAQLAAKATKRIVKPKPLLSEVPINCSLPLLGLRSVGNQAESESLSSIEPTEVQTIESIFDDNIVDDDIKNEDNNSSLHPTECVIQASIKEEKIAGCHLAETRTTSSSSTATSNHPSVPITNNAEPNKEYICFVCIQQFMTLSQLANHELNSRFHKKNCEMQGIERVTNS